MNEEFFTVSTLNEFIQDVIQAGFPQPVWVCGEIQGYDRQRSKNHVFFQLIEKDPDSSQQKATVDLVIWAGKKFQIQGLLSSTQDSFELRDDIEVKFLCKVDFYPPHGRIRLSVESVDPFFTLGKLAQEKQKLIAKLKEEGVLEPNKKLELAPAVLSIGLITSDDSAAYNDFISELKRSGYAFRVYLRNTLMQGKRAEADVCKALDEFKTIKNIQAVIITRGGGSISDLSCFDSEAIARKIAGYPFPVLSGIGHEINTTVTDLTAHTYAKTPTAIAQFLIERVRLFLDSLDVFFTRSQEAAESILERERERLKVNAFKLQGQTHHYLKDHHETLIRIFERIKNAPLTRVKQQRLQLGNSQTLLLKGLKRRIVDETTRLKSYEKIIDIAHPQHVLRRGFTITRNLEGKLIRQLKDVQSNAEITTDLVDGQLKSRVNQINKGR